jgi:hypothetical protein
MKRDRAHPVATPGGLAFTALLLLITLVFLATSLDLRASAAVVPRVVGVPLALLLTYLLAKETRMLLRQRGAAVEARSQPKQHAELRAILWLLALPALATLLGFIAGPALFVFGWMRFRARDPLIAALGAGVVTGIAIWLLFSVLLGVHMPHGVPGMLR